METELETIAIPMNKEQRERSKEYTGNVAQNPDTFVQCFIIPDCSPSSNGEREKNDRDDVSRRNAKTKKALGSGRKEPREKENQARRLAEGHNKG